MVLAQLLSKKFQANLDDLMPLLGRLSTDQQEELVERVLESRSLQEIVDWLKAAGQN